MIYVPLLHVYEDFNSRFLFLILPYFKYLLYIVLNLRLQGHQVPFKIIVEPDFAGA